MVRSFCTYNSIYRSEVEKDFAVPIDEWVRKTGKKVNGYAWVFFGHVGRFYMPFKKSR